MVAREAEAMEPEVAALMGTTEMAAMMMALMLADQVAGRRGLFELLHLPNHSLTVMKTRRPEAVPVLNCKMRNIFH